MNILATGKLAQGVPGTARATLTFGHVIALADGTLLANCRAGSTKDSVDETIEFYRSQDGGHTWSEAWRPFGKTLVNGLFGTLKICYMTELTPGHLLGAAMWVDRTTYPGQGLFNAETEGCLPMAILLAESRDGGVTWSPWRVVPMPDEIGPPSLTNPILKLSNGTLAMSIETNKPYLDRSPWRQKVVFFHSSDAGQTWAEPVIVGFDPTGRIFNWDQRCGVAPDGRIVTFNWTYDTQTTRYVNIHRRISSDHGYTWSAPEDLGFADQAAHPAILPDGRIVLVWVDRFQTHSIRARLASDVAAAFDPQSEVVVYTHGSAAKQDDNTGELLAEMALWSFGLPYAEALPNDDVFVVYYAGTEKGMDIYWARLGLEDEK
ncbi:MAG: sialidase family protein [Chloroflexi bacterium]|nr:sialidase family protein [Chloroflexota bacterium]